MEKNLKTKQELRKEILQLRESLTLEEREIKSRQIVTRVLARREFIEGNKILLFAAYKSEVETVELFEEAQKLGKDIYYPKVIGKEMEFFQVQQKEDLLEGYCGIREPEPASNRRFVPSGDDKVCIIMPGAVFDEAGNRIGYGGGYYDKFLQGLQLELEEKNQRIGSSACRIAIAFECQLVEIGQIQSEEHDIKPNYIITEDRVICG